MKNVMLATIQLLHFH